MACGCAERRELLIEAATALGSGDMAKVAEATAKALDSARRDVRQVAAAGARRLGALVR